MKDIELATPAAGLVSGIYLVVPVSDVDKNHVTLHFRKLEDGRTVVVVGTGRNVENSPVPETVRTIDFTTVTALRSARYQKTLTCLVSSPEFDHDQIVATFEFPEAPIPSAGLQIHLHTGGDGLESEVVMPPSIVMPPPSAIASPSNKFGPQPVRGPRHAIPPPRGKM